MRRKKFHYPAPEIGRIEEAWVTIAAGEARDTGEVCCRELDNCREPDGRDRICYRMQQIVLADMLKLIADEKCAGLTAIPAYVAHDPVQRRFLIWPEPDRDGEFCVRYWPPMVEV